MSEAVHEEAAIDPSIHTDENEVEHTVDSNQEEPYLDENRIVESVQEAQYFDASSMAPLTPTALVSLPGSEKIISDMVTQRWP